MITKTKMINYMVLNSVDTMELFQRFVNVHSELLPLDFPSCDNMALAAYPLTIVHYQCLLGYYYQEAEYAEICRKIYAIHDLGEIMLDWALATLEDEELVKGSIRQAELECGLPIPSYEELLVHMGAGDIVDGGLVNTWCQKQKNVRQQIVKDATLSCPICLNDDNDFDFMVALVPCGHGICRECIERLNRISRRTQRARSAVQPAARGLVGLREVQTVANHTGQGPHLSPISCPICRCEPTSIIRVHFNRSNQQAK